MPHQQEALRDYRFEVRIEGFDALHFTEVTGLGIEIDPIRYRSGSDVSSGHSIVPGRISYLPVYLTRGLARGLELWEWVDRIGDGEHDLRAVTITVLDDDKQPAVAFQLSEAWPSKLVLGSLSGMGNGVAIETLELTYERVEVEAG